MLKPHPDDRRKVVVRPETHKTGGGKRRDERTETQAQSEPPPTKEMSIENPDAIKRSGGS